MKKLLSILIFNIGSFLYAGQPQQNVRTLTLGESIGVLGAFAGLSAASLSTYASIAGSIVGGREHLGVCDGGIGACALSLAIPHLLAAITQHRDASRQKELKTAARRDLFVSASITGLHAAWLLHRRKRHQNNNQQILRVDERGRAVDIVRQSFKIFIKNSNIMYKNLKKVADDDTCLLCLNSFEDLQKDSKLVLQTVCCEKIICMEDLQRYVRSLNERPLLLHEEPEEKVYCFNCRAYPLNVAGPAIFTIEKT